MTRDESLTDFVRSEYPNAGRLLSRVIEIEKELLNQESRITILKGIVIKLMEEKFAECP